ncbi:hypothetical protein COS31_04030 [Candidatus Roizmanbacteria bacterium CG02_land_8_20_14_3_00_36_15]|uniref:FCP1 homology domain-containing protein n=2 Tax=Candidatus Roizmaniibacteriota TaxID=1752723 RepID=A0A2M8KKP0_9BACT|nr:MAG: hypothetical protein COS51_04130 [Candidatus Roizmanbacteria bacterium CG03_land_8_20_14_0_80_36_21]PIV37574.1 MAG: hypothetical protein COS31_04030 [Candidatus Roizmanbacteria bacterium CG02_land_8_20_14_3_00_36_15]PIY70401.1 MAG: hypothetical protein COY89_01155 [Candidatus Roizmanbacteria bacterium CG_4_10_14_0_8_um_filter_36_36]PJA52366.1 MAG: hypothetical protein CO166_06020 [Candidatus Roizmanbacteria bacterium CG_4_9_14_3_um_filter_36_11]PJC81894.1 MAG: hypothetical protein CO007
MAQKTLKVGFDLDGVILYNPFRIVRPFIAIFKKIVLGFDHRPLKFYYPKTRLERYFWRVAHKSSFFIGYGFWEILTLIKKRRIKAYIITARFSFLENDLNRKIKQLGIKKYFSAIYFNRKDEQPHLFKEKMIKKLGLDVYVEDNWDIVRYLNLKVKSQKSKVYWIYNILDRKIKYQYKFSSLKKVAKKL